MKRFFKYIVLFKRKQPVDDEFEPSGPLQEEKSIKSPNFDFGCSSMQNGRRGTTWYRDETGSVRYKD